MIITSRTPFRVSFAGGGTDLPSFYSKHGGCVVSTSIAKYMYVTIHSRFDNLVQLKYSIMELVEMTELLNHDIARVVLSMFHMKGVDIDSLADLPAKSGLGSSSAYTVGLINSASLGKMGVGNIAAMACEVEIDRVGKPIGKQDQYACAYGGLNMITFNSDGSVSISPILLDASKMMELEDSLMMFYLGPSGDQNMILSDIVERIESNKVATILSDLKDIAVELSTSLPKRISSLPSALKSGWELKKLISPSISSERVDHYYTLGMNSGGLGGKLLGSGGGGFLLFFCDPEAKMRMREALSDLVEVPFIFDNTGSIIIHKEMGIGDCH